MHKKVKKSRKKKISRKTKKNVSKKKISNEKSKKKTKKKAVKKPKGSGKKRIGIIGASGYTGFELIKILSNHKKVELVALNSGSCNGKKVSDVYKEFKGDIKFTNYSLQELNGLNLDLIFMCTPNGVAMEYVPQLHCKVIDLSADYRFKNPKGFEKVYKIRHKDKKRKAVYGLPELYKKEIKKADVVANPGCYVTACILAALPIQKYAKYIVFDCKSGFSGAGKKKSYVNDPKNYTDNMIAYKLTSHRHKYEIEQFVDAKLSFTPHALPFFRGIMCTAHIILKKKMSTRKVKELYKKYYRCKPFVNIVDMPEIKEVQNTNFCNIGGFEVDENNQLVVVSTIDNLVKGASGQAVQNMNLMFGFKEGEGL